MVLREPGNPAMTAKAPAVVMYVANASHIGGGNRSLMDIIMGALKDEKTTVLFIEHDMEIVDRFVSRVIAFYQGEIICDAPTADALRDAKVREFVIGEEYHLKRDGAHKSGAAHA